MSPKLSRLRVEGLRCLHGLDLSFGQLTALIGANGTGKSSIVRALEFLFGHTDLDDADPTAHLDDVDPTVTASFTDLPAPWQSTLRSWLDDSGTLTISRSRTLDASGRSVTTWSARRRAPEGFGAVREALVAGRAVADLKPMYAALRDKFGGALPPWSSKAALEPALVALESADPSLPTEEVDDHTLSFRGGGEWDLTAMVELLVLPAARDAAVDATEGRGSNLGRLLELTLHAEMSVDDELRELQARTAEQYQAIVERQGNALLSRTASMVNAELSSFAPGAGVELEFEHRQPTLTVPAVKARLVESGHSASIGRQGHGVQRAYVFSLLRAMLAAKTTADPTDAALLLVIEEPEVYQHPVRARYVARTLAELVSSTTARTQVVYTTHSPYFVPSQQLDAVRLLRLSEPGRPGETTATPRPGLGGDQLPLPRYTTASAFDAQRAATALQTAAAGKGQGWTAQRVKARLPGLLNASVAEGLFASAVLLVEGAEDAAYLEQTALCAGYDLAAEGVAVVSTGGKPDLGLALTLFAELDIPIYVVFDADIKPGADCSQQRGDNKLLTGLAGGPVLAEPGTQTRARWASMQPDVGAVVASDVGAQALEQARGAVADELDLRVGNGAKNPLLVRRVVERLAVQGTTSTTLRDVVTSIVALARG